MDEIEISLRGSKMEWSVLQNGIREKLLRRFTSPFDKVNSASEGVHEGYDIYDLLAWTGDLVMDVDQEVGKSHELILGTQGVVSTILLDDRCRFGNDACKEILTDSIPVCNKLSFKLLIEKFISSLD